MVVITTIFIKENTYNNHHEFHFYIINYEVIEIHTFFDLLHGINIKMYIHICENVKRQRGSTVLKIVCPFKSYTCSIYCTCTL